MRRAIIGDAHLGFKGVWTQDEVLGMFATIVRAAIAVGCVEIYTPGDLLDDTQLTNDQLRQLVALFEDAKKSGVHFRVLRGNHDSTKTYSATPAIDVLGELDSVWLSPAFMPSVKDGNLFVPHMKSQTEFLAAIDTLLASDRRWDLAFLHCAIAPAFPGGPNDMSIDMDRLEQLASRCNFVFVGHEHSPKQFRDNIFRVGSTMEFSFGELGQRYWYIVDDHVQMMPIEPLRRLVERKVTWPFDIQDVIKDLDPGVTWKLKLLEVPAEEYKNVRVWMDTIDDTVVWEIQKVGGKELVEIRAVEARVDIRDEFELFVAEHGIEGEAVDHMREVLHAALREVEIEEAAYVD